MAITQAGSVFHRQIIFWQKKLNAKNMAKGILFVGNATIINDEIIALKQRLI